MLPYPSGDLHIGHWYAMAPPDARARFMRMRGYNVVFPIGFDAFGLPGRERRDPAQHPSARVDLRQHRADARAAPHAWARCSTGGASVVSADPEYYRWTQWFFLQLFKNDLAYRKRAAVDWCPIVQHHARPRAGDRRRPRLRALRHAGDRARSWSSGSSASPTTPRSCSTTRASTGRSGCARSRPTGSADRRGRGWRSRSREPARARRGRGLHHPPRHPVGRDLHGPGARAPAGAGAHRGGPPRRGRGLPRGGGAPDRHPARGGRQGEDRRLDRRLRDQPGERRADADLDRRLRADGLRHRRDHGGAGPRPARLRVRPQATACRSGRCSPSAARRSIPRR